MSESDDRVVRENKGKCKRVKENDERQWEKIRDNERE